AYPDRLGVEDARPVHQQLGAPSPATLEMMMRSGVSCVIENGLTWSLVAANSMSDTVAMLVQRWPLSLSRSAQPHFTRELPASMQRIMRLSPGARARCAPRACPLSFAAAAPRLRRARAPRPSALAHRPGAPAGARRRGRPCSA